MTDFIPNPANYTMRGNPAKPLESRTEAKAFVPDMDDDQLRKLAREKLSEALQAIDAVNQPELTRKLCAEVKDRLDGKPAQAINMNANMNIVTVNATIRFADGSIPKILSPVDNLIIEHIKTE